ncbi:hypothetical protein D3C85_949880 [compost metagenome]
MDAAFKKGRGFAAQVVYRSAGMIVQVMPQVSRFLIEALLRHEGLGFQVYTLLFVKAHDAQAQPFVQYHPRPDVRADLRHQRIEGTVAADTGQARQRQRLAGVVAEGCAGPGVDQLRTEGDVFRKRGRGRVAAVAQTPYVLAMHAGEQADAAVGRSLVAQTELTVRHIDENLLEQVGENQVRDAFAQHQAYQRPHDMAQGFEERGGQGRRLHSAHSWTVNPSIAAWEIFP